MQKLFIEGHLGADAELRRENGHEFVSMRIASTRRVRKEGGELSEVTTWISAIMNGDGGKLLQYLKKGTRVIALGDMDVRTYHSEKQRALVAGINMFVRDLELAGGAPELVPRDLYDADGVAHRVEKYYFAADLAEVESGVLYSRSNQAYDVQKGWVTPAAPAAEAATEKEGIKSDTTIF